MNLVLEGLPATEKRIEDVIDLVGRDAGAAIGNGYLHSQPIPGARGGSRDSHPAAAVLDGILNQVA
jgi:hypothetical protein